MVKKYEVDWTKTYYVTGSVEIDANSKKEAEDITLTKIGDYEGSIQYDSEKDYVFAVEVDRNNEIIVLYPNRMKKEE